MKLKSSDIINSLTEKEYLSFFDCLLEEIDIKVILNKCDKSVAEAIKKIIKGKNSGNKQVSENKLLEIWNNYLSDIYDIIFEVSLEDGEHIDQDYSWEAPYLNIYTVSDNLDKISEKLYRMIDSIFPVYDEEENPFILIYHDLNNSMQELPEWLGADSNPLVPEENFSLCLLKWEWLKALKQDDPVHSFVINIKDIIKKSDYVEFDTEFIFDFILSLNDTCKKDFCEYLSNPINNNIVKANTFWHKIYMELLEVFNMERFIELSRENLHSNWKFGISIIKYYFEKAKYKETIKYSQKTIDSLLKDKTWNIEEFLFENISILKDNESFIRILDYWSKSEKYLSNDKNHEILTLNISILKDLYNINKIVDTYSRMRHKSENLYSSWKKFIINSLSNNDNLYEWIIDYAENKNSDVLIQKITDTISNSRIGEDCLVPQEILILTDDLSLISNLKDKFCLIKENIGIYTRNPKFQKSRCEIFSDIDHNELSTILFHWWKKYFYKLVPNPKNHSQSNYFSHVQSLNVLKEINIDDYNRILSDWRIKHKLRKNLWKELEIQ